MSVELNYEVQTQSGTTTLSELIRNEKTILVFTRHLG